MIDVGLLKEAFSIVNGLVLFEVRYRTAIGDLDLLLACIEDNSYADTINYEQVLADYEGVSNGTNDKT